MIIYFSTAGSFDGLKVWVLGFLWWDEIMTSLKPDLISFIET